MAWTGRGVEGVEGQVIGKTRRSAEEVALFSLLYLWAGEGWLSHRGCASSLAARDVMGLGHRDTVSLPIWRDRGSNEDIDESY